MEQPLPVSIVIPTRNRQDLLAQALPTYVDQRCAEIIVVDDASEPALDEARVQQRCLPCGTCKINILRNPKQLNVPASRMTGVEVAREPYIFFGEDDAVLSPGHIRSLFLAVTSGNIDVAASLWLHTTDVVAGNGAWRDLSAGYSWKDFVNLWECTIRIQKRLLAPIRVPWLTSLALVPRDVVLRHGFDSNFRGNAFREETDFFLRASCAGARLAIVSAPPAFHIKGPSNLSGGVHRRSGLGDFLWYEFWVMKNNYYFLRKNAGRLRQIGRKTHPLRDSLLYQMRRTLGYPGRLRFWLHSRARGYFHEISN